MPYTRVSNNPWINDEAIFASRISDKELQSIVRPHKFFGPQTNCVKTLLGFPLHEGNTVTAPYVGNGKKILQGDYSIRGLGKHLLHFLVLDEELVENELKTGMPNLQLYFQLIQIKHFLFQNPH